jgi:hypothetical protein
MPKKSNGEKTNPARESDALTHEPTQAKTCDLCGQPAEKLAYCQGNLACESCALAVQSDQNQAQADVPMSSKRKTKKAEPAAAVPANPAAEEQSPVISDPNAEPGPVTLGQLAERYIAALETGGEHALGTTRAYGAELQLACREIGAATELQALSVDRVREYFECAAVPRCQGSCRVRAEGSHRCA